MSRKVFSGLRSLWPLSRSTPLKTRCIALLLPHIDYCNAVYYYGLDSVSWKTLTASVNAIVCYGLRRYDSTNGNVVLFLGCSLETFLKTRSMTFLLRLISSGKPAHLREFSRYGQSSRSMQLVFPRSELSIGRKMLFVQGLLDWNAMPSRIRMSTSIDVFKRHKVLKE